MTLKRNDMDKDDMIRTIFRDYAVWVFTAVSGFMAFQVWNMSSSIERLAIEVKYLADDRVISREAFVALNKEIRSSAENVQANRASLVEHRVALTDLEKRVTKIESKVQP